MSASQEHKANLDAAISKVLQSNFDSDSKTCFMTLLKLLDNLLKQPDNPKVRSVRLSNKAIETKIVQRQGVGVLLACGFEEDQQQKLLESQAESFLVLNPEKEETAVLVQARRMIHSVLVHQLHLKPDEVPAMPTPKPKFQTTSNPTGAFGQGFNVYEGQRYDGKSAAVGASLGPPKGWKSQTESQLEQLQKKQEKIQEKFRKQAGDALDRQWRVTLPNASAPIQVAAASNSGGPSDKTLLAQHFQKQAANRQAAENKGFTTKAMRDLEQLKKQKVYSHTTLAIRFPDGCTVQGNFWPTETIQEVASALENNVLASPVAFDLYITPPRTLLESSRTLQELKLVPAARVHVSWKAALPSGKSQPGWYLQESLLGSTGTGSAMPQSVSLVGDGEKAASGNSKAATGTAATTKRKKSKADKEADMLKRMMGGMR